MTGRFKVFLGVWCGVSLLIVGGSVYITVRYWPQIKTAVGDEAVMSRYRESGLPVVSTDLFHPKWGPEQNAAPLYAELVKSMPKDPKVPLAAFDRAVALAEQMSHRKGFDFQQDPDLADAAEYPSAKPLATVGQVIGTHAIDAAHKGDHATALRHLNTLIRLSRMGFDPKSAMSDVVTVSLEIKALRAAATCIGYARNQPKKVLEYRHWASQLPPLPRMKEIATNSAWTSIAWTRNAKVLEKEPLDPSKLVRRRWPTGKWERKAILASMEAWSDAAWYTHGFTSNYREFENGWRETQHRWQGHLSKNPQIAELLLPDLCGANEGLANEATRRRAFIEATYAVSELDRVKARTYRLSDPESKDAFSGIPLHVKIVDGELLVYGTGADSVDDGGRNRAQAKKLGKKTFDVIIAVPLR